MVLNHFILALLWIIYCILHSVLASLSLKRKLQQWLGTRYRYYRLFYTVLAFIFLVVIVIFQISLPTVQLFHTTTFLLIIGSVIAVSGLGIMLVCIKNYFMTLSGLKSLFIDEPSSTLIIKGVHKYLRHPLYLGTFAFLWGLFILFPYLSLFIANVVIILYTVIAIRFEENKLVYEYGNEYKEYQKNVPKLFPNLHLKRKA